MAAAATAAPAPAPAPAAAATAAAASVEQHLQATKAVFETGKEQYDEEVRRAVLGYDDLSALATAAIGATAAGAATNVLCVGCGTGNEVLAIGRAAAQRAAAGSSAAPLRVTGADPAAAMIAAARKRVGAAFSAEQQQAVTLLNGFVHDLIRPAASSSGSGSGNGAAGASAVAAPAALGAGAFDAATSMLVMHLVPDVDDVKAAMASGSTAGSGKLAYLQSITHCLKPGARLFLVDGCGDSSDPALHALMDVWVSYVSARGAPAAMTDVLKTNALKWGKIVPVARVRQLLAAAGFVDVTHVYQAFHFNGFVARYAGPTAGAAS